MPATHLPPGYGPSDVARLVPEPGKAPERGPFERDRARVLHSSALRRLGGKTQVLAPSAGDFGRTRLTHSLEVAQVGRELGKVLGCDPDVVDTACLAHDLGHPPFGHNGEAALNEVTACIGGFEGNAQTLRLLTYLEPKVLRPRGHASVGLNLTRASLDAACKYPWPRGAGPAGVEASKFGVYEQDMEAFTWMRQGAPGTARCIEAQVMDLADDVAYSVHDVEDAIVVGTVVPAQLGSDSQRERVVEVASQWYAPGESLDDLAAGLDRLCAQPYWVSSYAGTRADLAALKDMTSQLIGRFVTAAEQATRSQVGAGPLVRYGANLVVPHHTRAEIAVLKAIAAVFVMMPRQFHPAHLAERRILTELVDALLSSAPGGLEPAFAADYRDASSDDDRLRVVVDQVASLTDISAQAWHHRVCGVR